jgi:hypothetical protein
MMRRPRSTTRDAGAHQAISGGSWNPGADALKSSLRASGGRFGDWGVPNDPTGKTGAQKPRKYRNTPTEVDGLKFDSKREAERYLSLRDDLRAGRISDLEVHPRFPLVIHGIDTGDYVADFRYLTSDGRPVVEDVKSAATRKLATYRLKKLQVWALYAIEVQEV